MTPNSGYTIATHYHKPTDNRSRNQALQRNRSSVIALELIEAISSAELIS